MTIINHITFTHGQPFKYINIPQWISQTIINALVRKAGVTNKIIASSGSDTPLGVKSKFSTSLKCLHYHRERFYYK